MAILPEIERRRRQRRRRKRGTKMRKKRRTREKCRHKETPQVALVEVTRMEEDSNPPEENADLPGFQP